MKTFFPHPVSSENVPFESYLEHFLLAMYLPASKAVDAYLTYATHTVGYFADSLTERSVQLLLPVDWREKLPKDAHGRSTMLCCLAVPPRPEKTIRAHGSTIL